MILVAVLVNLLLFGVPLSQLLPRAGMSQYWALVSAFPLAGLILLWIVAFKTWPGDNVGGRFE